MANINTQNISAAEEALLLAKNDLIAFGKLFLPDDFMRSETPFFHWQSGCKTISGHPASWTWKNCSDQM